MIAEHLRLQKAEENECIEEGSWDRKEVSNVDEISGECDTGERD